MYKTCRPTKCENFNFANWDAIHQSSRNFILITFNDELGSENALETSYE